ncbi:MAG: type IV secretion system DNA-binding domain-containing protein [Bryobacteraceae bacterium]
MSGMWISARPRGWPRHGFQKRGGAIFFGIVAMFAAWFFQVEYQWDGMQRYYLAHYVVSSAGLFQKYLVLHTVDRQGRWHPTVPAEVAPIRMASYPQGAIPFRLSDAALQRGAVRLANPLIPVDKARFAAFLRDWVYEGQTLTDLAKPGIWWGLGVMVAGLCLAWPQDRKARDILENGRRVRGAELVTRDEFNRKRKYGIGMGFLTLEPRNLRERVWIKYSHGPMIFIPEEDEPKHFLLMGDTGTGKSALIRQMLWRLTADQQTAIVYDPARGYIERFYHPERGDIILNPLDARSPYWSPGEELTNEAEARSLAESVFPDQPHEPPFFTQTPRKIFAQMLRRRMDAQQMVAMMCDGEALNRMVEGTELASMISQAAPSQREGVRASLNLVADALRLLKTKSEAKTTWTAREWAAKRRGWIFLTSTPELRAALQPLLSLWLDILVLRLMNQEGGQSRPVWFVLDELASLQKLPQLATALTENRKSNNPVVIGIQGKAQMETIYGHMAEAMLSQPWTKIFLKTSEPRAAKWVSDAIGEQDREWLRESRTTPQGWAGQRAGRETKTYVVEKRTAPLVLPAEIGGLPALHRYLKNGNDVVQMSFPYLDWPKVQPGFIEREWKTVAAIEPPRTPEEPKGGKQQKLERKQQRAAEHGFFD